MRKIILGFFAVISISLLASYVLIHSYVVQGAVDLQKKALNYEVEYEAEKINRLLAEQEMLVRTLAANEQIVRFMANLPSRQAAITQPEYPEVLATLQASKQAADSSINLLFFVSERGDAIIKHNQEPVPSDWVLAKRPWYMEAQREPHSFFSTPYPDASSGEMVVSVVTPVRRAGKMLGATGLDLSLADITAFMRSRKIGEHGAIILLDRQGRILFHPDEGRLLQPLADVPAETLTAMLNGQNGVVDFVQPQGETIGAYAPIERSGWSLLVLQPKSDVMQRIQLIQLVTLGIFLAFFLALAAVCYGLLRALKRLEEAQMQMLTSEKMASLGRLVAGVAHELNTPLGVGVTAISYLEQILQNVTKQMDSGALTRSGMQKFLQDCRESTSIVQTNLHSAARLVKSFKQISVDQSSEARRRFAVKPYMRDVVSSLRPLLKKTKLEVVIIGDEELEWFGMPGAISQILTNLISNSLLHAYAPDESGRLLIEVKRAPGGFQLLYADDGCGMEPAVQAKLFDPFFTTKRGQGGTGLGMYVVYNLVTEQLGGTIECSSRPEQGTAFRMFFPGSPDHEV